jgi:hypothetical protein
MDEQMNKKLRAASMPLIFAALAGCNSFPTQEYNKAGNTRVHVIALAPVGLPDKPQSSTLNAVGNNFGLIGGIVEATRASNASGEMVTELTAGNLDYKSYLPEKIISDLRSAGFEVVVLPGTRSSAESGKFLSDVPQAPGADAILDIYASYVGYVAAGSKTDYRPAVHIEARLLDANTQKVLFADQIYYNNFTPRSAKTAITIEPDPRWAFSDRKEMVSNPPDVTRGLRAGLDAVSLQLVRQLK